MKNTIITGVAFRHTKDEPDPTIIDKIKLENVKPRRIDDDYKPYIDYVPGRDV